jgi:lysophospholipase L1-like esterase
MKTSYISVSLAVLIAVFLGGAEGFGQNPLRFQKEVDSIAANCQSFNTSNLILFTGSSSIRLWKNLNTAFPGHNVVNTGFGGSEMSDLLYYADKLVLSFKPKQIFIYEGDNDISMGRPIAQILSAADSILIRIREELPDAEVIFIAAKPSLKRWSLKEKYETYNKQLEAWTSKKRKVKYVDVWTPMINRDGTLKNDIFIADGLHLNDKGYAIWTNTLKKFIRRD